LLIIVVICSFALYSYAQEEEDKFEKLRRRFKKLKLGEDKIITQPVRKEKPDIKIKKEIIPDELPGMVYIPEGEFIMGTNKGFEYEFPEYMVYVEGFYIDKYEITNMQYKRFVDYTDHKPPKHWKKNNYPKGKGFYPVTNISYYDAAAYAKWAGKRLPAEEEWEKAARYTDGRLYPWGEQWEKSYANVSSFVSSLTGSGSLKSIGSYPEGKSEYGVYDLCGNVWEWTSSNFMPYKGNTEPNENYGEKYRIIRGGSYRQSEVMAQSVRRDFLDPDKTRTDIGFRCAR
jgi:iron(II)-dependent oxidoreductase